MRTQPSPRLRRPKPISSVCIELEDNSNYRVSAFDIFDIGDKRSTDRAARLAEQFIQQNERALSILGIAGDTLYDGVDVKVSFTSQDKVGAVPLRSPISGEASFGLLVSPRFSWSGVGAAMAATGWRVSPDIVPGPLLPRSARKIPTWLLSVAVLTRIEALLKHAKRRFESTTEVVSAPRGSICWSSYALHHVARAEPHRVPCRFSALQEDRALQAAIHYVLLKQLESLSSQLSLGMVALQLVNWCNRLLHMVHSVPPVRPSPLVLQSWLRSKLLSKAQLSGIEAMEWTIDERGLGGLSDLQGLAWSMSMSSFSRRGLKACVQK